MSRNVWYICLYVTLLHLPLIMCSAKTNLVFVIDETKSMRLEIEQVTDAIDSIITIMDSTRTTEIKDIVVVTFRDPDYGLLLQSRSRFEIKTALSSIKQVSGGDCPERSLSGTKLGLEKSLKGSYIFVFTDDAPKDKELENEVKRLVQEKQSQVVFVITPSGSPTCRKMVNKDLSPYYRIAEASSGQVFRLPEKGEIKKVLPYVEEIIKGPKTTITDKVFPANVSSTVEFAVDDRTNYAIISASGKNVTLNIKNGPTTKYDKIVWTDNVKIIKVSGAGHYVAEVNGLSDNSIVVYGRTDFTFQHGFSDNVPQVFDASVQQPTSEIRTHLLISMDESDNSFQAETVQLWDMDENVIQELPLRQVSRNYFATEKFVPPSTMFKITVKGQFGDLGKSFIRTSKTPIKPISEIPLNTQSNENVANSRKVKEHDSITVTCSTDDVDSTPTISWEFKGLVIARTAILHIKDVTLNHSGDYTCIAEDKSGRITQIYTLDVEENSDGNQNQKGSNSTLWNFISGTKKDIVPETTKDECEKNSENYHYLMSVLPELEKIPPENKLRIRNKIYQAILDELNVVCF